MADPTVPSPEPAAFDLSALPSPGLKTILPAGLPTAKPADLLGLVAQPVEMEIPGYAAPDATEPPVLSMEAKTSLTGGGTGARWTVVGQEPGWVEVLVPAGRGALASQDPAAVNHHAVWVRAEDVVVSPEETKIVVDVAAHTLTLSTSDDDSVTFHVGVGIEGKTPTPRGLCSVVGRIRTQAGANGIVTSCQSEALDSFSGASYAATAIHQGKGFDPKTGGYVSNGCIRVPAQKFNQYLADVPIGTPVVFK